MNNEIVLIGAYIDTQLLGALEVADTWKNSRAVARITAALADLAEKGVRLDYERWLGHPPTKAERTALCRELIRLEAAGYLVRSGGRRRTTHVKVTALGKAFAESLLERPDELEGGLMMGPVYLEPPAAPDDERPDDEGDEP
ncbi:MAG: hypothetical protein R6V58_04490 [Planctomycetota bacterium]